MMLPMSRRRFLVIWFTFALLYLLLAVVGPSGLLRTGVWPFVNQHLLQVRAWVGDDIVAPGEAGEVDRIIPVEPRLDVTPYFRTWAMGDSRERILLSNLACGVKDDAPDARLRPVRYVKTDTLESQIQLERLQCHVGSPLGPAFLMLPLYLVLGSALATQWLGAMLGGLGVALIDLLLGWWLEAVRGARPVNRNERTGLVVLAGLGTMWIWLTPQGGMWMFAHTVATCALTLALVLAWRRRWIWAGLAFAFAITSRPPTLLAMPLLLAILYYRRQSTAALLASKSPARLRSLALAALFPAVLVGVQLTLNQARFWNPVEVGYRFMITPPELRQRIDAHGPFNPAFLVDNVRYLLLQPPVTVVDPDDGGVKFPFLVSDPHGMGVFFVTPAFLVIFLAGHRHWRVPGLLRVCWISLGLVTLPALLYFNTGWVQWGGRFLLDGWPMWLMLTSLGLHRINGRVATLLIGLSVVSNLWGALLTAGGWWP
jgi:hypothetical protein